jgi:DNA-binding MarR family transcriptional regulator
MTTLNEVIHQPVRMRIMAALMALEDSGQIEFTHLRDVLSLTDGNLGAHLRKLEDAGYVLLEKTFVARKPRTFVAMTKNGRQAFEAHVQALEQILSGGEIEYQSDA